MTAVPVTIVRFSDAHQPGWVECELSDVFGRRHGFIEKIPVVTKEEIGSDSTYPRQGVFACEVLTTWLNQEGRRLSRIDMSRPWGIESKDGHSEFVVPSDALVSIDC
jgi:hypothetical protein